jgi:hypothetical protein
MGLEPTTFCMASVPGRSVPDRDQGRFAGNHHRFNAKERPSGARGNDLDVRPR